MDIRKVRDNYDKDGKLRSLNFNVYRHMANDCRKPKKEKDTRKCYQYNKVEHLVKNYRLR